MPKNREQSFEINSFRIIYGTCRPGGDRKREYYFLEGMTFPAETVIYKNKKKKKKERGRLLRIDNPVT